VREKLPRVEGAHFTQSVRMLRSGKGGSVISDIDYTLRAFPNHHQALYSIIRLHTRRTANDGQFKWRTPPECYLQRALDFTPRDGRVYTLYGIYLHRRGLHQRAADKYQQAIKIQDRAPEAHYNFGLLLVEMERYEAAREHAREAYALDFPLPGLRKKLAAAGYPL
jgi:tetratricopeptide (TPR) repeat protein